MASRRRVPAIPAAYVAAKAQADAQLVAAMGLNRQVRAVMPKLKEVRERNHISETLTNLFAGNTEQ